MTETDTHETAAQRRARERSERDNAERQAGEQGSDGEQGTPDALTEDQLAYLATLDPSKGDDLPEDAKELYSRVTEKDAGRIAELRNVAAVEGFTVAESPELRQATTPVRNRKPVQKAMDRVAQKAYDAWVAAGRPSTWSRMPSITYYLDPEQAGEYRKWIRAAVQIINPEPYEKDGKTVTPSGVRVRFGGDFVLTEKMAAKIGKPEHIGKTVLAWAAVDKRNVTGTGEAENGDS